MLDQQDIERKLAGKLRQLLPQLDADPDVETPLHALGVDSMRLVELFIFIEMEYHLDLMSLGIELEHIQTLRSMATFIVDRDSTA